MEKLIPIILILTITISFFSGCNQQNGININYQTFNSGNISFPADAEELLTQEEIDFIIQLGEDLGFKIEYPLDWMSEYSLDCCGIFSVRFYPKNGDWVNTSYIRFDLTVIYPEPITKEKLKTEFINLFKESITEDIQLGNDVFIWKITGKSPEVGPDREDFGQGKAYILYDNVEVYELTTFFKDTNSTNPIIFDHMARSFSK